jgi:ferredoxin
VTLRVRIDADRCTGHGRCYDLAPDVFDANDDDGYGFVKGDGTVGEDLRDAVVKAVRNCPEGAVILDE